MEILWEFNIIVSYDHVEQEIFSISVHNCTSIKDLLCAIFDDINDYIKIKNIYKISTCMTLINEEEYPQFLHIDGKYYLDDVNIDNIRKSYLNGVK